MKLFILGLSDQVTDKHETSANLDLGSLDGSSRFPLLTISVRIQMIWIPSSRLFLISLFMEKASILIMARQGGACALSR